MTVFLFLLKVSAIGAALWLLRLHRLTQMDRRHLAIDVAFAALAFCGYIALLEAFIGIGFTPLRAWTMEAASRIYIRDWLAGHKVVAFFAFALWTSYFTYWTHRLSHKIHALWELHKVHHSATRMTGLSQFRVHPLEEVIISYVAPVLTILLLPELGSASAVNYGVLLMVHNTLIHSEWKASWGRWSLVLTSPLAHQIHHSTNPKHFNSNFGVPFIVWDRLHGTYVDPLKSELPTAYGVSGVDQDGKALLIDPVVKFSVAALPSTKRYGASDTQHTG